MPDDALQPGTQLGHYRIAKLLGRGGFGLTYQAWDVQLQRMVAIKEYFLHGQVTRALDGLTIAGKVDDEGYRKRLNRFLDEARTLAQFRDPRIVHVHGFHEANNTAYMVMDYVEGMTLRDHVRQYGTLSVGEARAILIEILKALRVIHAHSYLHRDIKPANIMRRPDGSILLLDFGSARQNLGDQERSFTVLVTAGYAPMEQYTGTDAQGPATDLYAVGACMLYCLTGTVPTEAIQRTISDQSNQTDGIDGSLKVIAARDSAGAQLAQVLAWLMRPQAVQRPQHADAVLQRLEGVPGFAGGIDGDRTMVTGIQAPSVDLTRMRSIPSHLVEEIRKQLEESIGERATPVLFKSIKSATNAQQLLDNLTSQAGDQLRASPALENITSLLNTAAARKAIEASGSSAGADAIAPRATAPRAATKIADDEITENISRELAKHIGPIAQMLVKRMVNKASSIKDLIAQLESEIPDDHDRAAFRKEMQKLSLI